MNKIIDSTESLLNRIQKCSETISDRKVKKEAETWVINHSKTLSALFQDQPTQINALKYLQRTWPNGRLRKKQWTKNLRTILKSLKNYKVKSTNNLAVSPEVQNCILGNSALKKIKQKDKKVHQLGLELNRNFDSKNCWNSCGVLMRIILERTIDRKSAEAKRKSGLKDKINFCLSNNVFGKSVSEALQKLNNSTKITGDIVAHDSNLLLEEDDITIAIVPFRILVKDISV